MSKKLETKVPEKIEASPKAPTYAQLLADMPGDPDAKTFLLDQIETSRSWGNSILRVPSDLLIAILDKATGR